MGARKYIRPLTGDAFWNVPRVVIPTLFRKSPIIWMFAWSTRTRIMGSTLA